MMRDCVTVLECQPDKRAAKLFRNDPQAKPHEYDAGMWFRATEIPIGSLADLAGVIEAIRGDHHAFIISGRLRPDVPLGEDGWTEMWHARRKHDREDDPAPYDATEHHWLCLDCDKIEAHSVEELRATLPEWLREAEALWLPSSNAHRSPTVRGKLFVWLDRPVGEAEARALCKSVGADDSVMVATQPIFIADPVFVNCSDPLESRAPIAFPGSHATPPAAAATRREAKRAPGAPDALDRAIAIAERLPPAVEGHGGDEALFKCAREIATVVHDADTIEAVLDAVYNPRCLPPWPPHKLRYEAERAAKAQASIRIVASALGRKLRGEPEPEEGEESEAEEAPDDSEDLTLECNGNGKPHPSLTNASRMLELWFGAGVWLDETTGEIQCNGFDNMAAGAWTDNHDTQFALNCEQFNLRLPERTIQRAVAQHAMRHKRNPVRESLLELADQWDGTPRIELALTRYWGCVDSPATRAASRVFHMGMAARGLKPGEKVDTVLILCGAQGVAKSTWLETMAGDVRRVNDAPISVGEREGCIALRGKWLVELAELESVQRKKDITAVKAFVTTRIDRYRPLYERYTRDVPRTCVFVGTSNETEILRDDTGERRWMPVSVRALDLQALRRERDQLIAEAAARVLRGEQHWPTKAEAEALAEHALDYKETGNPWDEIVEAWVARKPDRPVTLATITDMGSGAIPLPRDQVEGVAKKIAACLHRLGFTRQRKRVGNARAYVWTRARAPAESAAEAARGAAEARPN